MPVIPVSNILNKTTISIGDFEIKSFKSLKLSQNVAEHHSLKIVCRKSSVEKKEDELGEHSKNFIGEQLQLKIETSKLSSDTEQLLFYGIVTKIKIVRSIHTITGDEIIIYAKSPTILTDDGPNYFSIKDKSLKGIISNLLKKYDQSLLKSKINPQLQSSLHYSVQYNESSFEYLKRLASQYGEWFYYNGSYLIFGQEEEKEISLDFKKDLKEFEISLQPLPNNFNFKTNNYLNNDIVDTNSSKFKADDQGFNGFITNSANDIYNNDTVFMHQPFVDNQLQERVDLLAETQTKSIQLNQVKLSGRSDNSGIYVGCIIYSKNTFDGKYRVISVTHTCNEHGGYENEFEAVSANIDAYIYTNIRAYPSSEPQSAIITENHDPESMGRVKVEFPWQKKIGETTPWIRVVSLHAGSGKGFYFLPEVGEEVLIGFEEGNAERPYVIGSVYHAKAKPPSEASSANNDITILQTRSGCKFILNDSDGSITILDKEGSQVFLDGEGNIDISSITNINLSAPDGEINLDAKKVFIGNVIKPNLIEFKGMEAKVKTDISTELDGGIDLKFKGVNTEIKSAAKTDIKSSIINIDGSGIVEIKGGIIKKN